MLDVGAEGRIIFIGNSGTMQFPFPDINSIENLENTEFIGCFQFSSQIIN